MGHVIFIRGRRGERSGFGEVSIGEISAAGVARGVNIGAVEVEDGVWAFVAGGDDRPRGIE